MEEKKRREKLDYELGINYDNLMVRKDQLKVEQAALEKASHRKLKVQVINENKAMQELLRENLLKRWLLKCLLAAQSLEQRVPLSTLARMALALNLLSLSKHGREEPVLATCPSQRPNVKQQKKTRERQALKVRAV